MGTTTVINNHVKLPDGRSLVSTRGEKRFRILDSWAQDGYMVAKVIVRVLSSAHCEITRIVLSLDKSIVFPRFVRVVLVLYLFVCVFWTFISSWFNASFR